MIGISFRRGFVGLLVLTFFSGALSAEVGAPVRSLIGKYCLGCHNDTLLTAGVSFQAQDLSNFGGNIALWEKVLRKVSAGEMPPTGMPGPDPSVLVEFLEHLEVALDAAAGAAPNPGENRVGIVA